MNDSALYYNRNGSSVASIFIGAKCTKSGLYFLMTSPTVKNSSDGSRIYTNMVYSLKS